MFVRSLHTSHACNFEDMWKLKSARPTTSRKTGSAPGYTKFSKNHKIQTSKVLRFLGRSH